MFNVIICGTPATGKTTLIDSIKSDLDQFKITNLSKFAIENNCMSGYDEKLETHVLDEDKLIKQLEPKLKENKYNIIESIHADTLDRDSVNLVFVCRTDNTILYDRLKKRGYGEEKISNNIQAEIFQTILDEARDYFDAERLIELVNDNQNDLESNSKVVIDKVRQALESEQ